MNRPEEPLEWPGHFPPTDPVKKFFIGVRWLGPDLRFFKDLKEQQAERMEDHMTLWHTTEERQMAALLGRHLSRACGWKTSVFLPEDRMHVIVYGTRFQTMDDLLFEEAVRAIERELALELTDEFWRKSAGMSFGEVVREIIRKRNKTVEQAGEKSAHP